MMKLMQKYYHCRCSLARRKGGLIFFARSITYQLRGGRVARFFLFGEEAFKKFNLKVESERDGFLYIFSAWLIVYLWSTGFFVRRTKVGKSWVKKAQSGSAFAANCGQRETV